MPSEYDRRITLCSNAVERVTKKLGLHWQFAEDYQGIEIEISTEAATAKVIILMGTGHGPRFPKYTTLSVHGFFEDKVNRNLHVYGSSLQKFEKKFLPDEISQKWLQNAISEIAQDLETTCTVQKVETYRKKALVKRQQETMASPHLRHQLATFDVVRKSKP